MGGYYYLHEKNVEFKNTKDFKYIFYVSNKLNEFNNVIKIDGIEYCPHEIIGEKRWSYDNSIIEVLGHENVVISKFEKVSEFDKFELWLNVNFK